MLCTLLSVALLWVYASHASAYENRPDGSNCPVLPLHTTCTIRTVEPPNVTLLVAGLVTLGAAVLLAALAVRTFRSADGRKT